MLKEEIVACLKNNAKAHELFAMGTSFDHLLVHAKDLTAVLYDGDDGIESLLAYLVRNDWEGLYEEDFLIGVKKYPATVLLKAGGQLTLHIAKTASLQVIDKTYLDFIQGLFDELEERKQLLLAFGYQPITKVADIPLVPMVKHQYMAQYLAGNERAVQMLKGSARISVTIDYAHSDDFEKKLRVATAFAPVFEALFDNVPMLEGEVYEGFNANRMLLNEGDKEFNYLEDILGEGGFKYERYAHHLMNKPAIAVADEDGTINYVGAKKVSEVFGERKVSEDEAIGAMNMLSCEINATEEGIVLTMVDSLPYPLNMAYIALLKGSLYNADNLNAMYELAQGMTDEDIQEVRANIVKEGLDAKFGEGTVLDTIKDLFFLATPQLLPNEQHYVQPLDAVIFKNIVPKKVAQRQISSMLKN